VAGFGGGARATGEKESPQAHQNKSKAKVRIKGSKEVSKTKKRGDLSDTYEDQKKLEETVGRGG